MKTQISAFIFAFLCLSSACFGQQNPFAPVQSEWEVSGQNIELNYYNQDYCDYYLVSSRFKEIFVRPGRNNLISMPRAKANRNDPAFLPSSFRTFKGIFPEKFNPDFVYALPVRQGDSTKFVVDKEQRTLTYKFKVSAFDTIFAVRSGTICLNNSQGMSGKTDFLDRGEGLLVYHPDRSFALYNGIIKSLVTAGETVEVGQAIGIAKSTFLYLQVFFLDRNKFEGGRAPAGYPHTFINPIFHTVNAGNLKLEERVYYTAELTDEVITQDMTKSQIKRYEKKKLKATEKK